MQVLDENQLLLSEAATKVRRNPATVWRWARKGVGGVRLEVARVGGRLVTSEEAVKRFVTRLSEESGDSDV